jgi:hypothetical protein
MITAGNETQLIGIDRQVSSRGPLALSHWTDLRPAGGVVSVGKSRKAKHCVDKRPTKNQ